MAHQTPNGGFGNAHPVSFDPAPPEKPKEEKKEIFDEDISLEEALSSL